MTAPATFRAPGPRSGRPALRRLVAGDLDAFAADVWGQQPLLSRAAELPTGFADLLDHTAVDELISRRGLRAPFLRVAKEGVTFGDQAFTAPGGVGAGVADQVSEDKLLALFSDGATLVLQGLHRMWPPLVDLSQALAADLGHPVQVNAYVTPPESRGFDDHYDVHDVFVLQIAGKKRWRLHRPVHPLPLRHQPWTDHRAAVQAEAGTEPLLDVALEPGDCLYLPRGQLHAATALGGVSTHVTIGVHVWTRYSLAEQLVAEAMARLSHDVAVRGSLGVGADVDDPHTGPDLELVRGRLLAAVAEVPAEDVAARLGRRARDAQRAAPLGPLAQFHAASTVRDTDLVALRPHLAATLVPGAHGHTVLRTRAGDVDLHPDELAAVRPLLGGASCRAGEVGVDVVRRLMTAAILVLDEP
jgi:hypothetical protein